MASNSITTNILTLHTSIFINPKSPHFFRPHKLPPLRLSFPNKPTFNLSLKTPKTTISAVTITTTTSTSTSSTKPTSQFPFTNSTKSIITLFLVAKIVTKSLIQKLSQATVTLTPQIQTSLRTASPLFFASLRAQPSGRSLNTPLAVVAAGLAKWLDIYSGVLMVRVLLSWFPNIPWDRQPLSAIRDLCDPYLNLFRNIIPPVFDTLDVSPLLAFAVLGTLASILDFSRI